jgi:hypothetical protein
MENFNKENKHLVNEIDESVKNLEAQTEKLSKKILSYRDNAFRKFPLPFLILSSFGLVAVFYGFEKVIDQIPFLNQHPIYVLVTGIFILIITGTLFKKLS